MRGLKVLLLVLVGSSAALAFAWVAFLPRIEERGRVLLARELSSLLDTPVELASLALAAAPPGLEARGLRIGPDGSVARAEEVRIRILPFTSLMEMRLVAEADGRALWVDVPALVDAIPEEDEDVPFPPLALRAVELHDVAARVAGGKEPIEVSAGRVEGGAEIGGRVGEFRFSAMARTIEVRRRDIRIPLDRVEMTAADAGRGLTVQELRAEGDRIEISARLLDETEASHGLEARLGLEWLSFLDEELNGVSGLASLRVNFEGDLLDPAFDAALAVENMAVEGLEIGRVEASLGRSGDRLVLTSLEAAPLDGAVRATGSLGLSGTYPVELRAEWQDLEFGGLARQEIGPAVPDELRSTGDTDLSATLVPWTLKGRASGTLAVADDERPLAWSLEGGHEEGRAQADLTVRRGENATARLSARMREDEALRGDFTVEIATLGELCPFVTPAGWPDLDGALVVSGQLGGTLHRPKLTATLAADRISVRAIEVGDARGSVEIDPERVIGEAFMVDLDGGSVLARGTVALSAAGQNDWQVVADRVPLDRVVGAVAALGDVDLPIEQGLLTAGVTGRGPWPALALEANLTVDRFRLLDEPFERFAAGASARLPEWSADLTLTHPSGEWLQGHAAGQGDERVSLEVDGRPLALEKTGQADRLGLGGTVTIRGQAEGPPRRLAGRVHLKGEGIAWRGRRVGDLGVEARGEAGRWEVSASLLDAALRAAASIDQASGSFSARADWSEAQLGRLLDEGLGIEVESSGSLRAEGNLADPRGAEGEIAIDRLAVRSGAFEMEASAPIRARRAGGRLAIEPFLLAGNGTELRGAGTIAADGSMNLTAAGQGSLQLVEMFAKPVRSASGTFSLRVNATGRAPDEVQLGGEASIDRAAFDVGLPVGPTRTSGRFVLSGSTIEIAELAGRLGGGTFAVSGSADIERGLDVTWQVDQVSTGLLPSLEHELSGQGTVSGPWKEPMVGGEIRILRMLYDRRIALTDFLPSFQRELRPARRAEAGPKVRLDLHVLAPGEIFIDNNFARIEARADLRVRGSADDLRLAGPIEVLTGEVFFRGRTFEITNAVIEFRPELRTVAALNIQAESEIETPDETYTVTVRVEGTTERYRVLMSADDASLSQTDVASLIAFGRTTAQMQRESRGFSLTDLIGLAPGEYQERAERGAASLLALDRVDFEPAVSRETGQFEPQLTLGKNLTEDLSATLTTTFGVNAGETFSLDYLLTPGFSLLGTWESQTTRRESAIGAGVRFRRRFRDLPRYSLLGSHRPEKPDAP
jgi:autotransporter translocation and assembly factor TamB